MSLPEDFVWGVSAAAYQVEGAAFEDGKGLSVWDVFSRRPGAIWNDQTADVSCDHYHRYRQDIALMRELGVQAYRASVSWPRVLPDGTGKVNAKGLDFYDRLVDEMIANGITPYLCLFHWDFPYELFCRGGWLNRDVAGWFGEYAKIVVDRLGDRVGHWITMNEPVNYITNGLQKGGGAPGLKLPFAECLRAWHHNMLAHGTAVQAIRAAARRPVKVSYQPGADVKIPATDSPKDIAAARAAMFENPESDTPWSDAAYLGIYPPGLFEKHRGILPDVVREGDLAVIGQKLDFVSINVYFGSRVRQGPDGRPETLPLPTGGPLTLPMWPVAPEAMYWGLKLYHERYGLPVLVSENGMSNIDWVATDGCVHDPQRIDFMRRYLRQLQRAAADGVPVLGYLAWSFLDNFEWAGGVKHRYGLVHVDYETQKRTVKDSGRWFANVIKTGGESLREG